MSIDTSYSCPVCGHPHAIGVGPTPGGDYRKCAACGLETRVMAVGEDILESFEASQCTCYGEHGVLEPETMQFAHYLKAMTHLRIVSRHLPRGRLLEVGPGTGQFLYLAKKQDYQLAAVEHSPRLAQYIREQFQVEVRCCMLEEMEPPDELYDGLVSRHVVEHVPDPLRHLESARRLVRQDGYLFLATPNVTSWSHRVARNRWPAYSTAHLHLFSPDSLRELLIRTGWRLEATHTNQGVFHWVWTLKCMLRRSQEIRPLNDAGAGVRKLPRLPFVAASRAAAAVSWPLRRVQAGLGGGAELFIVARAE